MLLHGADGGAVFVGRLHGQCLRAIVFRQGYTRSLEPWLAGLKVAGVVKPRALGVESRAASALINRQGATWTKALQLEKFMIKTSRGERRKATGRDHT